MESVKKQNYLAIAVIAIGIIVISGFILQLSGGFRSLWVSNSNNQGITVSGEGFVTVKPDIARATLGMEAVAATAKEAQRKNTEAMNKIVTVLKNLGLEAKDIQTTDFSLFPERRYDKSSGQNQVAGYRAVNQVTITVRHLAKLGEAIDQSIQAGANHVQNISFTVETPDKWRAQAIARAVKDARAKADALARASGVRIKRIIALNESGININPYQMEYGYKKAAVLTAGDSLNTPLEPGSIKVTANVQMNFGI